MKLEIIFPGNNPIGSVIIEKVDSQDNCIGEHEGVIICSSTDADEELPGIFLRDLELGNEVMDIFMGKPGNICVEFFTEFDSNSEEYSMTVKSFRKNADPGEPAISMSFGISQKSYRKFMELTEFYNAVILILKSQYYFVYLKCDPTSSNVIVGEVELMH